MTAAVASLLPPLAASFALLRAVWPARLRGPASWGLQGVLAVGLAIGLSSCVWFVGMAVLDASPGGTFRVVESIVYLACAAGGAALARRRPKDDRSSQTPHPATAPEAPPGKWSWLLAAALGLVAGGRLLEFAINSWLFPHGLGDAWFTWNMRARFLYRGGEHWRNAFSNTIGEAVGDYPLLVPLTNARLWCYAGEETTLAPTFTAVVFSFGVLGVLCASVAVLRGRSQAALAGLALLSTASYFFVGSSQVADVPLSFYVLATLVLFALYDADDGAAPRLLLPAGLLAGLAAWTKNEGSLFFLSVLAVRAFVTTWDRGGRAWGRELGPFLAGAAPVLAILCFFKLRLAPEANYLVGEQTWRAMLQRLGEPERYIQIAAFLAWNVVRLGGGAAAFLPVYWLLAGTTRAERPKSLAGAAALTAGLLVCGYLAVYLITPRDLLWQLRSSQHRLLMHVWPAVLLAFFLAVRTPEEAGSGRPRLGE